MEQISGPLPLVDLVRWFGLQFSQTSESDPVHGPGDRGDGSPQQLGDVREVQPLVPKIHSQLQLLRIEHTLLGASNHRRGWTTRSVAGQPAVSAAKADSALCGQLCKAAAEPQVMAQQP